MQRRQTAFLAERGIIGPQPARQSHTQQRVMVLRVACQTSPPESFSPSKLLLEKFVLFRVRLIFLAPGKSRVVLVELRLQNAQPVEFGKENPRRLADRPHRIVRILLLPGLEFLLRARKIEVIEMVKSA